MIIIDDEAKWIWNWAEDNYPGAIQILDFYHAKKNMVIHAFSQLGFEIQSKECTFVFYKH